MGAMDFSNTARGKTAQEAFNSAVEDARYEHGHGGYTGSIAEKPSFFMVKVPPERSSKEFAEEVVGSYEHEAYQDKWGPAGCIDLGDGEFVFFGSASS